MTILYITPQRCSNVAEKLWNKTDVVKRSRYVVESFTKEPYCPYETLQV